MTDTTTAQSYRLFVSADETILVRIWASGSAEVCRRDDPSAIWGPPVELAEEPLR